jgi:hypothetical protein
VAEENEELRGRERADLRNEQLRMLIAKWEKKRDTLLDEISFRQGQVELLEELVKQSFERIVEVNKEEKAKEEARIQARLDELKKQAEAEEEARRNEEILIRQAERQKAVAEGKKKGKPHPMDRIHDMHERKTEARQRKKQE